MITRKILELKIVPVGASKGLRIPKAVLLQCDMKDEVEVEVLDKCFIVKAKKDGNRKEWEEYMKKMKKRGEDKLLIDDDLDMDIQELEWEW